MLRDIIAIVPAAGVGARFDESRRKIFSDLNGIPLALHALRYLNSSSLISEIIPVLRREDISDGYELVRKNGIYKVKHIVEGGRERQDSVSNAIRFLIESGRNGLENSAVLIHDGARPIIPAGTLEQLADALAHADGAAPALPPRDTLKQISKEGFIVSTVDRAEIRAIQTPQIFHFTPLRAAYDKAFQDGFYATDDAALLERTGARVKIIDGSPYNIKVTTREDRDMVKCIIAKMAM